MRGRISAPAVVLFALGALAFAGRADAAPFTNGSFETGPAPGTFINLVAGNTGITGWTVRPSDIDYIGSYWTAEDGGRSIDLSGGAPGGVEQTFDTNAGTVYQVTFYLAGNLECGSTIKGLDVGATGNPTAHYTFDVTGHSLAAMGWRQETYTFVATGASTALFFQSTEASACGPALDNVSVAAIAPIPALSASGVAVAALLVVALGVLVLARRATA